MNQSRVIVVVKEELYTHRASGVVAARYCSMGLTAYGDTTDDASNKLKKMFNQEVNYYREKGLLSDRLERLGVEWYWEDEYPSDRPAYENTDEYVSEESSASPRFHEVLHETFHRLETDALPLAA